MLNYLKRIPNCLVGELMVQSPHCNLTTIERVRKLQDENDNLSRHTSASSCRKEADADDDDDDDESESLKDQHMQLILELSEKVSPYSLLLHD